jgi:hypothetical protein
MRLLLLLLSFLAATTLAWWGHGHCLVLQVAEFVLQKDHPSVLQVARDILLEYSDFFPRDSSFVGSAAWSDNLNAEGFLLFKTWHYYDRPYVLDANVSVPANITDAPNMLWALDECTKGLSSKSKGASPWAASFYLRWINHLMGDLHQPLHNVAQYSLDIADPQGDRGGNGCLLDTAASNVSATTKNLHSFFDSAGGQFMFDPYFPAGSPGLTPQFKAMFEQQATELMGEFPRSAYNASYIETINFAAWSREGYDLAVSMGYNGNGEPGLVRCGPRFTIKLTPEYVARVQRVTRERIVVAGYRLANLMAVKIPTQWMPHYNSTETAPPNSGGTDRDSLYNELRRVLLDLYNGTIPGGVPQRMDQNATATPDQPSKQFSALEIGLTALVCLFVGIGVALAASAIKKWHTSRSLQFRRINSGTLSQGWAADV